MILFGVTDGYCGVTHLFPSVCFATVTVANKTCAWTEFGTGETNDGHQVLGQRSQVGCFRTTGDQTTLWLAHICTGEGNTRSNCRRMGECDDGGHLVVDLVVLNTNYCTHGTVL